MQAMGKMVRFLQGEMCVGRGKGGWGVEGQAGACTGLVMGAAQQQRCTTVHHAVHHVKRQLGARQAGRPLGLARQTFCWVPVRHAASQDDATGRHGRCIHAYIHACLDGRQLWLQKFPVLVRGPAPPWAWRGGRRRLGVGLLSEVATVSVLLVLLVQCTHDCCRCYGVADRFASGHCTGAVPAYASTVCTATTAPHPSTTAGAPPIPPSLTRTRPGG